MLMAAQLGGLATYENWAYRTGHFRLEISQGGREDGRSARREFWVSRYRPDLKPFSFSLPRK